MTRAFAQANVGFLELSQVPLLAHPGQARRNHALA